MPTCEDLATDIAYLTAALVVDDAAIQAAQNVKTAHQMQLWYDQYNYFLQSCDGGDGSGSGSGSGFGMINQIVKFPNLPIRSPSEMLLIVQLPGLLRLHRQCLERAVLIGAVQS